MAQHQMKTLFSLMVCRRGAYSASTFPSPTTSPSSLTARQIPDSISNYRAPAVFPLGWVRSIPCSQCHRPFSGWFYHSGYVPARVLLIGEQNMGKMKSQWGVSEGSVMGQWRSSEKSPRDFLNPKVLLWFRPKSQWKSSEESHPKKISDSTCQNWSGKNCRHIDNFITEKHETPL